MNEQASVQQHQQQQQESTVADKRTPTATGDVTGVRRKRMSGSSNCNIAKGKVKHPSGRDVSLGGDDDDDDDATGDDSDTNHQRVEQSKESNFQQQQQQKQHQVNAKSGQGRQMSKRRRRIENSSDATARTTTGEATSAAKGATFARIKVGPACLTVVGDGDASGDGACGGGGGDGETGGHERTIQCMNNSNNRSTSRKSSNNCEDERPLEKQSKASTSKETSRTFQMKDPLTMDPIYHPHYSGHCNSGYVLDAGDDDDDDEEQDDHDGDDEGDYDDMSHKEKKFISPPETSSSSSPPTKRCPGGPVPKLTRGKEGKASKTSVMSLMPFFNKNNKLQVKSNNNNNNNAPSIVKTANTPSSNDVHGQGGRWARSTLGGSSSNRSSQFGRTPDGRTFRRRTLWKTSSFGSSVVSTTSNSMDFQRQQQQQQQQSEQFPPEPKNKPKGSKWRQQRLEAWQPMFTSSTVLPSFLAIGIFFIPISIIFFVTSSQISQIYIEYTDCSRGESNGEVKVNTICTINFTIKNQMDGRVYLYYILKGYYQSHRLFAQSRDESQLHGHGSSKVDPHCKAPFDKDPTTGKPIAPCGIAANALFNDTFQLIHINNSGQQVVNISINRTHIAWPTDKEYAFRNPSNLSWFETSAAKPPNWPVRADQLNPGSRSNGFAYEPFMVWMRTSAFPTVKKLYGRIFYPLKDEDGQFASRLPAGNYSMLIEYNYRVDQFGGRKYFLLTTTSWYGGSESFFMAVMYLLVGCCILLLTLLLYLSHLKRSQWINEVHFTSIDRRTPFQGNLK